MTSPQLLKQPSNQTSIQQPASIIYKNWRGEVAERRIVPESFFYGATQWHPENQWFMRAFDLDKQEYRDFALKDIHSWK